MKRKKPTKLENIEDLILMSHKFQEEAIEELKKLRLLESKSNGGEIKLFILEGFRKEAVKK